MQKDNSLIDLLVRHSRLLLALSIFLLFAVGYGMKNLYFNADYRIFFGENDPNLAADERLKASYGRSDNILFIVNPADGVIFSSQTLPAIESLTTEAWQIPYSRRVDSVTNYQHPTVEGDDIFIEDLVRDSGDYTAAQLAAKQRIALNEIGLVGRLVSASADTAGVNVTLNLPENSTAAIAEAVTKARAIAHQIEAEHPGVSIYLAGIATTEQTFTDVATADSQTLIPAMFALVLVLLAVLLRSITAALCTALIIAVSVVVGMGFAGWWGLAINNVNISAPTIIMTLAIADCVHIFNTFLLRFSNGMNKVDALASSLRLNAYPVFLTSLTTAFGFLTMNFSESPPFRELGTISAAGVLGALWGSLFILPGLIMLMPFRRHGKAPGMHGPVASFSDFVIRNHNRLFYSLLALVLLALAALPRIELNDNPIGYFSEDTPVRQASEFVEDHLSGTQVIYYSLDAGEPDEILHPNFLNSAETFTRWLRDQPEVVNVESFTDILKRINQILHEDDPAWYRLPEDKSVAAQYFLIYEMSMPYGLDPGNQVSRDKSSMKIGVTLKNQKSRGLIAFEDKVQQWFARELPALATHGASHSVSFAHIGQRNIESMLSGSFVAVVLISLSLILTFRSLRYGLLSFIPNLFPALVTLGIWGALVTEVNMAASVVFSITLGIIVDDTVHFMVKYLNARRQQDLDAEGAVRYAFSSVGVALVTTSVMLALGFLVMALSDFTVNSTSGKLVAMTITVAIVLDLLFLPAILLKFDRLFDKTHGAREP